LKYTLIFTLFFALFINPIQPFALSCAELPPFEESFTNYDAVISGKVLKVITQKEKKYLSVQVERSFKEIHSKNIVVEEDITWGTSVVNETYLFFLNKNDKKWENPLCSPTVLYNDELIAKSPLMNENIQLTNEQVEEVKLINAIEIDKDESGKNYFLVVIGLLMILFGILIIKKKKK
jgi:LPXTG-motif cell wall-anchored protein